MRAPEDARCASASECKRRMIHEAWAVPLPMKMELSDFLAVPRCTVTYNCIFSATTRPTLHKSCAIYVFVAGSRRSARRGVGPFGFEARNTISTTCAIRERECEASTDRPRLQSRRPLLTSLSASGMFDPLSERHRIRRHTEEAARCGTGPALSRSSA